MSEIFARNKLIWGEDFQKLLNEKHIAVFGLGGVGGFAAEALARSGIGELTLIDFDKVSLSNINRQLIALHSKVGESKALLFQERLKEINPNIKINLYDSFYTAESNETIFSKKIDFVIDAIDTLKSKVQLLEYCHTNRLQVITSLGAGNRIDPTKLKIMDISEMPKQRCSFIKNLIRILDKKNIHEGIIVVVSEEAPHSLSSVKNQETIITKSGDTIEFTKISPGSVPFVPSVAGYYMAYYAVNNFLEKAKSHKDLRILR